MAGGVDRQRGDELGESVEEEARPVAQRGQRGQVLVRPLERDRIEHARPLARAPAGATTRVLADIGKSYAVYMKAGRPGSLVLDVAPGRYRVEWVDTRDGAVRKRERRDHPAGPMTLNPPPYRDDIALAVEAE